MTAATEHAVLAGGCFWGMQQLVRRLPGVVSTRVGYSGGNRSAIFYTSEEQRRVAKDTIADVEASRLWPGKVVTDVSPAGDFWQAEPEHQDYLERYPGGYTCHFVRPDWKLPRRDAA
jgi:peptide-methionine (S)-S-oxide reductase